MRPIEAGTRVLSGLGPSETLSKVDVLIIYLGGIQFGNHRCSGRPQAGTTFVDGKKVRASRACAGAASENATVTTALLEDLVARGIRPDRRRANSSSMERRRYAARSPRCSAPCNEGQRCRNHTLRNVVGHLPNAQHDQARATLSRRLEASRLRRAGASLTSIASWLQRDWPECSSEPFGKAIDEIFEREEDWGLRAHLTHKPQDDEAFDSWLTSGSPWIQRTQIRVTNWNSRSRSDELLQQLAAAHQGLVRPGGLPYACPLGGDEPSLTMLLWPAPLTRDEDNIGEMQKVG